MSGEVDNDILATGQPNDEARAHSGALRKSRFLKLSEEEIAFVREEIRAIGADESVFHFNEGGSTSYSDAKNCVYVCGDVFPDLFSEHPRANMSVRAVLAHEYYGHYLYAPSRFDPQSWQDEFRASYFAALQAPNLTEEDRAKLMEDAFLRAGEAGVSVRYNRHAKRILYGYE